MNRQRPAVPDRRSRRRDLVMVNALCAWFDEHQRDLPWRRRRTGYTSLVAEFMLQQTQVSRVVASYRAFLRRFPTVKSLAAADEQDVLAMWQGMGYYRRAMNLHRAAKMIVAEFGGRVPRDVPDLMRLPGVGRYTAGAIASIVHGKHEPIVDGNVRRVLSRWSGTMDSSNGHASTWQMASALVRRSDRPGVFNEAMMELGAVICTPRSPRCDACPIATSCQARRGGMKAQSANARRRATVRIVHHHAVVLTRNGRVLVNKRDSTHGMWAGLWQVPTIESDRPLTAKQLQRRLDVAVCAIETIGSFTHHTTHRHIRFHVYRGQTASKRGTWRKMDEFGRRGDLPMSNAQRRVLAIAADAPVEATGASR